MNIAQQLTLLAEIWVKYIALKIQQTKPNLLPVDTMCDTLSLLINQRMMVSPFYLAQATVSISA